MFIFPLELQTPQKCFWILFWADLEMMHIYTAAGLLKENSLGFSWNPLLGQPEGM